jgi:hypothetical protein
VLVPLASGGRHECFRKKFAYELRNP